VQPTAEVGGTAVALCVDGTSCRVGTVANFTVKSTLVRQCLRLPAVGFAQLNRVWSASTIALPQLNHKKKEHVVPLALMTCCGMPCHRLFWNGGDGMLVNT
jgi:hypothetical protein